jgi:hypothetical protein
MTDSNKSDEQKPVLVIGKNAVTLAAIDFNNPEHTKLLEDLFEQQIKKKEKAFERAEKRKQKRFGTSRKKNR